MGDRLTGGLAQAGQYFAGKIGTIFVRKFFVEMEFKPPLRQAAGTLAARRAAQWDYQAENLETRI